MIASRAEELKSWLEARRKTHPHSLILDVSKRGLAHALFSSELLDYHSAPVGVTVEFLFKTEQARDRAQELAVAIP